MVDGTDDDGMPTFDEATSLHVCGECGVAVATSATGKALHIDATPDEHDVSEVITLAQWLIRQDDTDELKSAIADMILHHGSIHPLGECRFAERLDSIAKRLA